MMKTLWSSILVVAAMLTFTSCLNDSNEDITYYDDTAVTGFSLGTVNQYVHTTASDGVTDSIYKVSYSASGYAFYIDQLTHEIYNPDSLPQGTDGSKVVVSMTTKNSGTAVVVWKNQAGQDSLAYYASTDSLDFTEPLRMRIFNLSGTAYREYTIRVNVHRQSGTELNWSSTTSTALAAVGDRRLVSNGTEIYLFGQSNGQTVVLHRQGSGYEQLAQTFDANAYKSATAMGGYLYVLSNGAVMRSADGQVWEQTGTEARLTQLLGASDTRLYARTADGLMSSADGGATWTAESLDDEASNLPTDAMNLVCLPAKANAHTNTLVLVGQASGQTRVWRKVEENADDSQTQSWAYYPDDEYNKRTLPLMDNLQVIGYDGGLLATGGDFSTFYKSNDQGLTWIASEEMTLTDDFGKTASPFGMAVDTNNIIYISKSGSNAVWSGRLARLGWAVNQQAYTE